MLAGCSSSTLLSPRHRLRSEQACHFPSSMSTHRLDLPTSCTFPRKDTTSQQALRPVGLSVDKKPVDSKPKPATTCSLKQNIRLPPLATTTTATNTPKTEFWEETKGNNLKKKKKRIADQDNDEFESFFNNNRAKRTKSAEDAANFWFQHNPTISSASPWVDSFVTKITNFGEKGGVEGTTTNPPPPSKEASVSSESHQSLRLNENDSDHEQTNPYHHNHNHHHHYHHNGTEDEENQDDEHRGFELISLLAACVDAITSKNIAAVNCFIAKLGDLASPTGKTSISRVCSYFTEALALRVTRMWPHVFHIATPRELDRIEDESGTALRLLNQVTPIPRFLHFTSNEILLRAFEGKNRVHIIDFDIKQGLQWPSLFQSLASRTNPPTHVRVTGIGESKPELHETGERLAGFARALNLPFEFHPVVDRLEDVRLWMLHVKEHESVAVNCVFQLHKTLHDRTGGALRDFLGLIRSTNPSIVIVAEQEAEHNGGRLDSRVCNSLKYYCALFDSIDHCLPQENHPVRGKIEEMYGGEIRNIVACEGRERVERHERFEKWRKMMEEGGFRSVGISEREMRQSEMLLKMYACENYNVKMKKKKEEEEGEEEEGEGITLGWLEQPVCTVSGWTLVDAAGGRTSSSSYYSQPC